jgi:hypothetical protein
MLRLVHGCRRLRFIQWLHPILIHNTQHSRTRYFYVHFSNRLDDMIHMHVPPSSPFSTREDVGRAVPSRTFSLAKANANLYNFHELSIYATTSIIFVLPLNSFSETFSCFALIHINHVVLPIACFNKGVYHRADTKRRSRRKQL